MQVGWGLGGGTAREVGKPRIGVLYKLQKLLDYVHANVLQHLIQKRQQKQKHNKTKSTKRHNILEHTESTCQISQPNGPELQAEFLGVKDRIS